MARTQLSLDDWAVLTPGEQAVAGLVAQGLRNAEVAEELSLSVATVKTHLSHAFRKLGVSSRSQLAASTRASRPFDPVAVDRGKG